MDDGIRAERDDLPTPPRRAINGEEGMLDPEGLKHLLAAVRRDMVKEALAATVIGATAYALGGTITFQEPEKVALLRDAIDIMAAAVGMAVDWPTDSEGNAAPDPLVVRINETPSTPAERHAALFSDAPDGTLPGDEFIEHRPDAPEEG